MKGSKHILKGVRLIMVTGLLFSVQTTVTHGQTDELRRLSIDQILLPDEGIPVFRDHPDKAALIVYSSLTKLSFQSNMGGIVDQRSEPMRGRYILIIEPFTQIIVVDAPGYIQGRFRVGNPSARDVLYYEIEAEESDPDLISVIFNVRPEDALLYVDDQQIETNRAVQLLPGSAEIRLEREGYRTVQDAIKVNTNNILFQYVLDRVEMEPVRVQTDPAGATVSIDGVGQGETDASGALTFFLFPGLYELSVSLDGYVRQRRSMEIVESGDNIFLISLQRNIGTLLVNVSPVDARARLGNRVVPSGEPVELEPNSYRLEVQRNGHDTYEEEITITLGEQLRRDVNLERNTGTLTLNVTPRDARVEVNRREYVSGVAIDLAPGLYRLEVSRNGYDSHLEDVSILRGEELTRQITLVRQTGGLRFNVMPSFAKSKLIADNGRVWDEWEGIRVVRDLPVGEYRLAVMASGYLTHEERIIIEKHETSEVEVSLEEGFSWDRDTKTAVVEVTNPATGRVWMDRNLGASRAAISSTDAEAYGDLYQWGRPADGHQNRNSPTTSNFSSTDQPSHDSFILALNIPYDWRSPQNDNLWQGVNGTNNPCPAGYRLPNEAEWEAEINSWSSNNSAGAFASPLKLPMAGDRSSSSGSLGFVGFHGRYWSSAVFNGSAQDLRFGNNFAYVFSFTRAYGFAVRCIMD